MGSMRASAATAQTGGHSAVDVPASVAGAVAAVVTAGAIYLGSQSLRTFDAALIGYATATILEPIGVETRPATCGLAS